MGNDLQYRLPCRPNYPAIGRLARVDVGRIEANGYLPDVGLSGIARYGYAIVLIKIGRPAVSGPQGGSIINSGLHSRAQSVKVNA